MSKSKIQTPVAICSRSLSKNLALVKAIDERFANFKLNKEGKSLSGSSLVKFLSGAHGAIIALEKLNDGILSQLPKLKVISKYGVGLDNLDLKVMEKRGVKLGWTPGINARSVSELTMAFALGLSRNVFQSSKDITQGIWKMEGGHQISRKTVGLVGFGHVGKDVSTLFKSFGCKVLIHDILDMSALVEKYGFTQVDLSTLLKRSDIVSLHVPYNETTHHLISKPEFRKMDSTAILINTSRGNVVDEDALHDALATKKIRGAACDVYATEPAIDSPLFKLREFIGTSHIGGSASEAIEAMGMAAINNLAKLLQSERLIE